MNLDHLLNTKTTISLQCRHNYEPCSGKRALTLPLLLTTQEAYVDSADQDQTAQSDL